MVRKLFSIDLSEKSCIRSKIILQLSISDLRMLLLTWKIKNAKNVYSFFCLRDQKNSCHCFKLGRMVSSKNLLMLIMFFRSQGSASMYFILIERTRGYCGLQPQSFLLEVVILSTITGKLNEKLRTPSPHFDDGKMACFGCCLNLSLG